MSGYTPSKAEAMDDAGDCCRCHVSPPCEFCLSLDEEEADAMANGGPSALRELWNKRAGGGV